MFIMTLNIGRIVPPPQTLDFNLKDFLKFYSSILLKLSYTAADPNHTCQMYQLLNFFLIWNSEWHCSGMILLISDYSGQFAQNQL